jgi:hypothetical protein
MGFVSFLEDIFDRQDDDTRSVRSQSGTSEIPPLPPHLSPEDVKQGLAYLQRKRQTLVSQYREAELSLNKANSADNRWPIISMVLGNRNARRPMQPRQIAKQAARNEMRQLSQSIAEVDNWIAKLEGQERTIEG